MTEFTKQEFIRLIDLLPQTDPRTNDYLTLLHSIECFDSIANSIDEMDNLRRIDLAENRPAEVKPTVEPEKIVELPTAPVEEPEKTAELPTAPVEEPKKTYEAPDIRAALVAAKAKGIEVKDILSAFGVDNFGALPASKYNDLMEALEVL